MNLKSIGVKDFSIDNFNNNYILLKICNNNLFIKIYKNIFGINPHPYYNSTNGIYITGKSTSYKIPKNTLNKMILEARKDKLKKLI
jgi:hypothetical protein